MSAYKSRKAPNRKNAQGHCLKEKCEIGRKLLFIFLFTITIENQP